MWEPRDLTLVGLFVPIHGIHLWKEAIVMGGGGRGPLILVMHVSGLHIDLDRIKIEATP